MKHKIFFRTAVLSLLGLGVIFSLTISDILNINSKKELLEVSVILKESDNFIGTSVHKGMQRAAVDFGVELRYLTPSTRNNFAEQATLFNYEVGLGADAIILEPADSESFEKLFQNSSSNLPIVALGQSLSGEKVKATVSIDIDSSVQEICDLANVDANKKKDVLIVNTSSKNSYIDKQIANAYKILRANDFDVSVLDMSYGISSYQASEILSYNIGTIIAFEADATKQAVNLAKSMNISPNIYGLGSSKEILSLLESEKISAIVARNDYAYGYLAVKNAYDAIKKNKGQDSFVPHAIIEPDNIYDPENQALLFPIN